MHITKTKTLTVTQKAAILLLWNNEYPSTLQYQGIAQLNSYLEGLTDHMHYLLSDDNDQILGWGFTFLRDSAKWFAIILDKSIHGQGYGTTILNAIKADETQLYGWATDHNNAVKANGTTYRSPVAFYLKNEFTIEHNVRLETEQLSAVKIKWSYTN